MSYISKPFEELDIIDDFLMNAVACDEEVGEEFCRTLVTSLLQRELGKIRVNIQKVIPANTPLHRGIRMDVEVIEYNEKEEVVKNIYDIEPNKISSTNLQKHNRFYQAKIDGKNMKAGEKDFVRLPNLFVITITNYDPFGYDYMMYTVRNQCVEIPEMNYDDGLTFIYFNTTGVKGGNLAIKQLLNYIQESKINNVTNEATQTLHSCVSRVRILPEVRMEYMTLEEKIFYERLDAKNEGKIEAIVDLLDDYGSIPDEILEKMSLIEEEETIRRWLKLAASVSSIEEFLDKSGLR